MKLRSVAAVIVTLATLVRAGPTTDASRVTNDEFKVSLTCPADFAAAKPKVTRQKIFVVSKQEDAKDVFIDSIGLSLEYEMNSPYTLERTWPLFTKSMDKAGMKIESIADAKLGDLPAKCAVYSHPLKMAGHELSIKAVLYFAVKGNRVWTLDARGEERRFAWLEPIAREAAASVVIE
jgi:hypothetical protein